MSVELCSLSKQQALTYVPRILRLFSPAVNPGDKSDEQKPCNARLSKEEIKVVRHRSPLPLIEREIEQCQCRYDMKRKTAQIRAGLEKSLKMMV